MTVGLFTLLNYCEQCCSEQKNPDASLGDGLHVPSKYNIHTAAGSPVTPIFIIVLTSVPLTDIPINNVPKFLLPYSHHASYHLSFCIQHLAVLTMRIVNISSWFRVAMPSYICCSLLSNLFPTFIWDQEAD